MPDISMGISPRRRISLADETCPLGARVEEMFHSRPLNIVEPPQTSGGVLKKGARVVEELYITDNLVWRFAALRLWQEYQAVRKLADTAEIRDRPEAIIYPVRYSREEQMKSWNTVYHTDLLQFLGESYFGYIIYQWNRL